MKRMTHRNTVKSALRMLILFAVASFTTLQLPRSAFAQNSSAAVTGAISDPTGAKVPGAKIELTNVDTKVDRTTLSNKAGDYNFVSVPPARYTLTISAPSFQTVKI